MGKLTLLLLAFTGLATGTRCGSVRTAYMTIAASTDDVVAQQATNAKLKRVTISFLPKLTISMAARKRLRSARANELSMTKPGETFYRLVPDASKRAATAGQTHR
ncbi:Cell division protein DivIC (FtsB) stabilizesFtsL against RasP cleavage [Salmonella enterica subsp. enterica]|uniref:Cell division protein DivIC (FtsB) stabilizesFtsL against RasP cleavage n=1 Tax=Salmonella enterica I TaxID=59201 RepID=A0A447TWI9_SALET|nr:Cell division protein DivIC (FtsB) stabilizesFtsL against RasP cleavage [Salmonella enterica subsp. enterica]